MSDNPRAHRRPVPEEEAEILVSAPSGHPVGPAIQEFLEQGGLSRVALFGMIAAAWAEVVGDDAAEHCHPRRLDGEDLVVVADHRGWITELSFRQQAILQGLEAHLGMVVVRRLKVTLGS